MILVLAAFLAEADHLRGARLAGDVEPDQFDSSCGARLVHDGPHRMDYFVALVRRDAEIFGLGTLESMDGSCGPIIETSRIVSYSSNGVHLFQQVRHIHLSLH